MGEEVEGVVIKLVLDALKPRELSIIELSKIISRIEGVSQVSVTVREVDAKTETIKIVIHGKDLDYDDIEEVLSESGIAVRSIDEVVVEKKTTLMP